MKELTRLLNLRAGTSLRIPVMGNCFSISMKDSEKGLVKIRNCKEEDNVVTGEWGEIARFIRIKVIDIIGVENDTLYKMVLVEMALAFVNQGCPSNEVRKSRIAQLHKLTLEEPLLTKLMCQFDR